MRLSIKAVVETRKRDSKNKIHKRKKNTYGIQESLEQSEIGGCVGIQTLC